MGVSFEMSKIKVAEPGMFVSGFRIILLKNAMIVE